MANILIIDDDTQMTQMLEAHFSAAGHRVTVALKGSEGLQIAARETPDLILLDVILPDLTGYQLCSRLRQSTATESTPILLMTGVARNSNQHVFGFERGANEYLIKPLDLMQLNETVNRYLKHESHGPAPKKVIKPMHSQQHPISNDFFKIRNFFKTVLPKPKIH